MARTSVTLLCLFLVAVTAVGQDGVVNPTAETVSATEAAKFARLSDRYWKILSRRPRRGTAFDAFYKLYLEAGRLPLLRQKAEAHCKDNVTSSAAHLLLGLILESSGEEQAAEVSFQQAATLDENSYYPHSLLASTYARGFEFEKAVTSFERALELDPPSTEMLAISKQLGQLQLRLGRNEAARRTWNAVAQRFPGDGQVLRELAELLTVEGQYDAAIDRWKQVVTATGDDRFQTLKARIEIAHLLASSGRRKSAVEEFTKILADVKPGSWAADDVRNRIEQAYLKTNDTAGLLQYCEQRLQDAPGDLETMVMYARCQVRSGDRDAGLKAFREVLQVAPTRRDVREAYIQQLVHNAELDLALRHCQILARQNPRDSDVIRLHGEIHLRAKTVGDIDADVRATAEQEAVNIWKRIAELNSDDGALAIRVAEVCRQAAGMKSQDSIFGLPKKVWSGDTILAKTSEQFYREAIRRTPHEPRYHEYLGEFLDLTGDREGAIRAWANIVEPPNNAAKDWHRLAEVYRQFDYLDESILAGKKSLELAPNEFGFHDLQLQLMIDTGDFDAALKHANELQRVAENDGQAETALKRRVEVFDRTDTIYEEIDRLVELSKVGKASVSDLWTLGLMYSNRWRLSQAANAYELALQKQPGEWRIVRHYARTLERTSRTQEAIDQYRKLARQDRANRGEAYERIIDLELQLGHTEQARAAADALAALSPGSIESRMLQASVAFRCQRDEDGLEILQRAVRIAPQDVMVRDHLARILAEKKQYAKAADHYWRCFELSNTLHAKISFAGKLTALGFQSSESDGFVLLQDVETRLIGLHHSNEDRKTSGLCLAESYRIRKLNDKARTIVEGVSVAYPNDPDIMQHMINLCSASNKWDEAVTWQRKLNDLHGEQRGLHQLARLLVLAGKDVEANAIWKRMLLEMDDDRLIIAAIDKKLKAGQFEPAAILIDKWLPHSPDNWRLLYRAGLTCLILDKQDDATRHFLNCRKQTDSKSSPLTVRQKQFGRVRSNSTPAVKKLAYPTAGWSRPAFHEITQARYTLSSLTAAADLPISAPSGSRTSSSVRSYKSKLNTAIRLPTTPAAADFAAFCGLHTLAESWGESKTWFNEQNGNAKKNIAESRTVLMLAICKTDVAARLQAIRDYIKLNPTDPLPHVARFYKWNQSNAAVWTSESEERRNEKFRELHQSFTWIEQEYPEWRSDVLPLMILNSNSLLNTSFADDLTREVISSARSLSDLGELPSFVFKLSDGIQLEFMKKLVELTADVDERDRDLLYAITNLVLLQPFSKFADEELYSICIRLVDQRLRHRTPDDLTPIVFKVAPSFTSTMTSGTRVQQNQLISTLGPSSKQQVLVQANAFAHAQFSKALSSQYSLAKASDASPELLKSLSSQRNLQSQAVRNAKTSFYSANFPLPGPYLHADDFIVLQRLAEQIASVGEQNLLLREFGSSPTSDRQLLSRYTMATTYCLWWFNSREDAIALLSDFCEQHKDDNATRLLLAQAQVSCSEYLAALATLDEIKPTEWTVPDTATKKVWTLRADRMSVFPQQITVFRAYVWQKILSADNQVLLNVVLSELERSSDTDLNGLFQPSMTTVVGRTVNRTGGIVVRRSTSETKKKADTNKPLPYVRLLAAPNLAEIADALSIAAQKSPSNQSVAALLTLARFKQEDIDKATSAALAFAELCEATAPTRAASHVMNACRKHDATGEIAERIQKAFSLKR